MRKIVKSARYKPKEIYFIIRKNRQRRRQSSPLLSTASRVPQLLFWLRLLAVQRNSEVTCVVMANPNPLWNSGFRSESGPELNRDGPDLLLCRRQNEERRPILDCGVGNETSHLVHGAHEWRRVAHTNATFIPAPVEEQRPEKPHQENDDIGSNLLTGLLLVFERHCGHLGDYQTGQYQNTSNHEQHLAPPRCPRASTLSEQKSTHICKHTHIMFVKKSPRQFKKSAQYAQSQIYFIPKYCIAF